jgi:acetoacetyl-CoA synthetase
MAQPVCTSDVIEEAAFFPELQLNFADNLLSTDFHDESLAVVSVRAGHTVAQLTRRELREGVERAAGGLRRLGLEPGDRVASMTRNGVEAVVLALASTALGAVYSTAGLEMKPGAIIDRFRQVKPRFLVANLATPPFETGTPVMARVATVAEALPDLQGIIDLDSLAEAPGFAAPVHALGDLLAGEALPQGQWARFPFNHPLFLMFTSGTTGSPKCIVHGAGGTLIEHLKEHRLHCDLRPDDTLFFHTSCSWMMWHWQMSALASGASITLYDGPVEDAGTLWRIAATAGATVFGTSPPYLKLSATADLVPAAAFDLSRLRSLLSTGSILYDDQFLWVWERVGRIPVQSISGGTDILGCFVLGSPDLPVRAGEIQCRSLAMLVQAAGATPDNPVGEMVCANPFPSRPLGFLDDPDGTRFHEAYFSRHPGVWTQGDLISLTPAGGARLHGRSDGVLNIRGIRVGPVEIYRLLADLPEIQNLMAVEQRAPAEFSEGRLVLLVVLRDGLQLGAELITRIRRILAEQASAAHVPELILQVAALPRTHSGKQSEAAATDAVNGEPVRNVAALANPECLDSIRCHPSLVSRGAAEKTAPHDRKLSDPAELEAVLRHLWEKMFGFSPIDPDQNFFDLGGSSLMAARLFADIQEVTGHDLPVTLLLRAPTLRALCTAVVHEEQAFARQIVELRPGAEGRRPFFMIHSLAGAVLELRPLRQALRTERPIYGIQARGLEAGQDAHSCIREMARDYIALMRSVQGTGPYTVGGHSFGGLVAFEIAQQLVRMGETVDQVILIDTGIHARFLPLNQYVRYRASRPIQDIRSVLKVPPGQRLQYLQGKAGVLLDRVRIRLGKQPLRAAAVGGAEDEAELPPALRRVRGAAFIAFRSCRPTDYEGHIVYVRAEERERFDPEPVWRKVSKGGLDVHWVSGDHLSMITEPHVQALARVMDDYLQ